MNRSLTNRIVAICNIGLPDDIMHTICGYIYYTLDECKNKVKNKMREFANFYRNNVWIYEGNNNIITSRNAIIVSDNVQFQYETCNTCGNYTMTHIGLIHKNVFCKCDPAHIIYTELDYNIYDVYYTG